MRVWAQALWLAALLQGAFCPSSYADTRIQVTYRAGEAESAVSARAGAMAKLRLAALPQLGQLIRGHTRVQDEHLSERIDQLAEAAVRLSEVAEEWVTDGPDRLLRLSADVELDQSALDRFLEAVPGPGPTRLPLDEPLLAARQRQLQAIERDDAKMGPWVDGVLAPILATPIDVELLQLEIPPDGQYAQARVRVGWQISRGPLGVLCERISCIHRPSGDRVMLAGFVRSAAADLVDLSPDDAVRLTLWLHNASLRVYVLLGNHYLGEVPVLESHPEPDGWRSPGRPPRWRESGVAKEFYTQHSTELAVRIPLDALEREPLITASIGLGE